MKKHSTFILAGLVFLPVFPMENTSKTELHTAAANSSLKNKVQKIIESNPVQIHQKDGDGNTPLHEAAYYGCTENADLLLRYGAQVNSLNYKGETPLDKAHYKCQYALEKLLKKHGGQYSKYKDSLKELDILLWQASGNFDYEKMLDLLKRGANPNAMHDDGSGVKMTPLARIARSADYTTPHKVMQVLLDYGANINLEDSAGWTPYGRTSQGADSQTGDSIGKFFSQRNARFKKGSI